MIFPLEIRG